VRRLAVIAGIPTLIDRAASEVDERWCIAAEKWRRRVARERRICDDRKE
jgi:hypothetical protein